MSSCLCVSICCYPLNAKLFLSLHSDKNIFILNLSDLQQLYALHPQVKALLRWADSAASDLKITGLSGSSCALVTASLFRERPQTQILLM